jgi:hypothetical protein
MTQPFTDAEVNAAIAATVEELRARIQYLETYARCDAETITQLQGRVGELENNNQKLCDFLASIYLSVASESCPDLVETIPQVVALFGARQ